MTEGKKDRSKTGTDPEANVAFVRKKGKLVLRQIPPDDIEGYDEAVGKAKVGDDGVEDVTSVDLVNDKELNTSGPKDPVAE